MKTIARTWNKGALESSLGSWEVSGRQPDYEWAWDIPAQILLVGVPECPLHMYGWFICSPTLVDDRPPFAGAGLRHTLITKRI